MDHSNGGVRPVIAAVGLHDDTNKRGSRRCGCRVKASLDGSLTWPRSGFIPPLPVRSILVRNHLRLLSYRVYCTSLPVSKRGSPFSRRAHALRSKFDASGRLVAFPECAVLITVTACDSS